MAKEILMPRQGNTVESCLILEWKKQEGDDVAIDDIICEVETDKAAFEIESEESGILLKILYEEGADVPVLTPIAIIGQPGEDISSFITAAETPLKPEQITPVVESFEMSPVRPESDTNLKSQISNLKSISPRARNLALAKGLDWSGISGSGPDGRIIERDVVATLSEKTPLTAAAVAAMIEQGMQAPAIGTGIGGRVTTADLTQQPVIATPVTLEEFPGSFKELTVKGVRKIIASRMLESLKSTAQLTLNMSADASTILAYRKRLKTSSEELGLQRITINDLVMYAVSRTLTRFPLLNAHFLGDTIREFDHVHLGMAIDAPRGLMVPAVRFADLLSLKTLSQETKRLITACQEGSILPDELKGATFTITNLGALGIESFTPVLNPPEVAILGVCAIQPKPVMVGENIQYVPHIGLSLTFDHQAVDGAPAAKFFERTLHGAGKLRPAPGGVILKSD